MTRAQLVEKMNGHVHLTWKQIAWLATGIVPWMLTISIATALNTRDNVTQQQTLDERSKSVEELVIVKNDVGWLKKSLRRIEQRLFGNSVIPPDDEEEDE